MLLLLFYGLLVFLLLAGSPSTDEESNGSSQSRAISNFDFALKFSEPCNTTTLHQSYIRRSVVRPRRIRFDNFKQPSVVQKPVSTPILFIGFNRILFLKLETIQIEIEKNREFVNWISSSRISIVSS